MVTKELDLNFVGEDHLSRSVTIKVETTGDNQRDILLQPKILLHTANVETIDTYETINESRLFKVMKENKLHRILLSVIDNKTRYYDKFDMYNSILVNFSQLGVKKTIQDIGPIQISSPLSIQLNMLVDSEDLLDRDRGLGVSLARILHGFGINYDQIKVETPLDDKSTTFVLKYLLDHYMKKMTEDDQRNQTTTR
jgi:hypothetical protein